MPDHPAVREALRALVAADPSLAQVLADELRRQGYAVTPPADPDPDRPRFRLGSTDGTMPEG